MKNEQKRFTALILTAMLAAGCISCGESEIVTTDTSTQEPTSTNTTAAETVDPDSVDDLPALDFKGKIFSVLAAQSNSYKGYITVEEATGDILNDTVYESVWTVEERLNFKLKQTVEPAAQANTTGGNLIMAGDHVYDMISLTDRNAFAYAYQGMLIPYEDIPYINLDKSYWVQGINDVIRMADTYYLAYSDFNLSIYDYTCALAFNKRLLEELKLDSPYAMVDSGDWTIDVFHDMCLVANRDLNGDNSMDDADQYGWSSLPKQIPPTMWIAAGAQSITKNSDDLPEFTMATDTHFAEVYAKVLDIAYTTECWHKNEVITDVFALPMFKEGRALFQTTSFGQLGNDYYRSMDDDFGILPHPKWDSAQETYYSRVEGGRLFAIPVTLQEKEMTGAVLEALSYQASVDIIPAYFEITLKTKYTRDDESARMFDLIMDNRVYDLGDTFWCTKIRDGFMYKLFLGGNENLASAIAENKAIIEGELNKAIDGFLGQ